MKSGPKRDRAWEGSDVPRPSLPFGAQDITPHQEVACGCDPSQQVPGGTSHRSARSFFDLVHPLHWAAVALVQRSRPNTYRVISYDVEGVESLQLLDATVRVSDPYAKGARRWATPTGYWYVGVGAVSKVIRRPDGRVVGLVGYRYDGTWIVALDLQGNGVANLIHVVGQGQSQIFADQTVGAAIRDWMQFGTNPLCPPGIDSAFVDDPASIDPCRGSRGGDPGLGRSSTDGGGGGPGPVAPGDESPSLGLEFFCGDVSGVGGPALSGGNRAMPNRPVIPPRQPIVVDDIEVFVENAIIDRQNETGKDWPGSPDTDPRHPFSDDNDYWRNGQHPGEPTYPYNPSDEQNYYSPMNPYGPNYDPGAGPKDIPPNPYQKKPADASPETSQEAVPDRPDVGHPGTPEGASESLFQLCEHWNSTGSRPSLIEQLVSIIEATCTDPVGQPTEEGGAGGECGGFRVERRYTIADLAAGERCQDQEGRGECEETVLDFLRSRVAWRSFPGLDVDPPCDPIVCSPQARQGRR